MELKDIIKEYKHQHHLSNKELAQRFHVTHITVGRWLRGEVKSIQEETAQNMSRVLGFDVQAILQGSVVNLKKPILGNVKAGYDMYLQENYIGEEPVTLDAYEQGDFFLQVQGDSMIEAGIIEGSLLYIKQMEQVQNGDIVVVMIGDEVTVKYYYKEQDSIRLKAANHAVMDKVYTLHDIQALPIKIIGKVLFSKTYIHRKTS